MYHRFMVCLDNPSPGSTWLEVQLREELENARNETATNGGFHGFPMKRGPNFAG